MLNDTSPQLSDNKTEDPAGLGEPKPAVVSKKWWLVGTILVVAILIGIGFLAFRPARKHVEGPTGKSASLSSLTPAEVSITKGGFVPLTISAKVGQAVVWTNHDRAFHLVASDPYPADNTLPGLNSRRAIALHGSYTYIFTKAGTYTYHDNLKPSWHGTVIVQ